MDDDDAHLLDLCDAAIGERARREHELPWLRERPDPEAPPARVDAWYPEAKVVLLLVDEREDERSRRLPAVAERIVQDLGSAEDREDNRVWPHQSGGYARFVVRNVADEGEWDDEEAWEGDEDEPYGAEPLGAGARGAPRPLRPARLVTARP